MKIKLESLLLIGVVGYFLLAPKNADAVIPVLPIDDGTGDPIEPIPGTQVDVYKPNELGEDVYHHTEVVNADGTISFFTMDAAGNLVPLVKVPKPRNQSSTVTGLGSVNYRNQMRSASGTRGTF